MFPIWQVGLIFEALDANRRGTLEFDQFENVLLALRIHFESPPSTARQHRLHRLRMRVRRIVSDWRASLALDCAVALNARTHRWRAAPLLCSSRPALHAPISTPCSSRPRWRSTP